MTQHIFLHIPKTAGSSIRTLIQQNYPAEATIGFSGDPEARAWYGSRTAEFKEQYRLVHGHFPYGIHQGVRDYRYFTFLRDPVERHFSDYHFLKRYQPHPMHNALASGRVSLLDWARIYQEQPMYRDLTTRIVSGDADTRVPDRCSLERSKYRLSTDFVFVGLAERFDESVLILAKRLGWSSVFYLTKNVSPDRAPLESEARALALPGFMRDLELYAWGQHLFESSPELRDPIFAAALVEFRGARRWLESHLACNPHDLFVIGNELPPVDVLVTQHCPTPALDQFLARRSWRAA